MDAFKSTPEDITGVVHVHKRFMAEDSYVLVGGYVITLQCNRGLAGQGQLSGFPDPGWQL